MKQMFFAVRVEGGFSVGGEGVWSIGGPEVRSEALVVQLMVESVVLGERRVQSVPEDDE